MKKLLGLLIICFSMQLSAQELYWYDVLLEVSPKDYKQAEQLMDAYYSSIEMPEGVTNPKPWS